MMTHKSAQDNFRNPEENNKQFHRGDISQDSQVNKKKYKLKKKNSKHKPPSRFESGSSSNVARSRTHQEVPRAINAPLVPIVPTSIIPVPAMTTYFPQYCEPIGYTVAMHDWSHVMTAVQIHNPVYSVPYHPLPMAVYNPTPVLSTPVSAYTAAIMSPPMMTQIIPQPLPLPPPLPPAYVEEIPMPTSYGCEHIPQFSPEQIVPSSEVEGENPVPVDANISSEALMYDAVPEEPSSPKDPIECYLTLPKDLFPRASMLALDPNPLIDELCKTVNLECHLPWILDLEFGLPKAPLTRAIPIYDVKFNSIHCKNTPNAIHPGFESCSEEFKKVFLFYYDCIVSAWYRGYVATCCDISVEHFQEWLLLPMQVFGMCWP